MTREEILKMAAANANGGNMMELARQMQEFLNGGNTNARVQHEALIISTKKAIESAPKDEFYVDPENGPPLPFGEPIQKAEPQAPTPDQKRKPPKKPKSVPLNHCKPWTDEDYLQAADLVQQARSPQDLSHIAWKIGRTRKALNEAIYKGKIPLNPVKLNKSAFPNWAKVPFPPEPK